MAKIELRRLTKHYADGTVAVRELDLDIAAGEFMILVGPSGSGKSTALRMIAGLEEVTSGELRIGDVRMNEARPKDRDVAMVFQNYALYPQMSVRRNMGFALRMAKVPRDEIDRRVCAAAEELDLTEHLDRRPAMLSGGQRQRVAMGRAIVREPRAFLMDEPLSNLDAKLRVQMRTSIALLQRRLGTTTVYVTHDQVEAMTLGDRVAVMRRGELQQVASPADLYDAPRNVFVAGFMGSPAMNFFPGTVRAAHAETPIGAIPIPSRTRAAASDGRRVWVGVRPEDFEDAAVVDAARPGHRFETQIGIVEPMGAEVLAYFGFESGEDLASLRRLSDDGSTARVVGAARPHAAARLDRLTRVRAQDRATLWLDPDRVHLFDAQSGSNLLYA